MAIEQPMRGTRPGMRSEWEASAGARERQMALRPRRVGDGHRTPKINGSRSALAGGLGWFSIGLGLFELASPGSVARLIGVDDDEENRQLLRACGAREIASGVGILSQSQPSGFLWSRVGGDVMDLALLGSAMSSPRTRKGRLAMAAVAVGGVLALDLIGSSQASPSASAQGQGMLARGLRRASHALEVREAITVNRPADELYRFWRDLENLPRFMAHLDSVRVLDERRSRWRTKAPAGTHVEWDAEIIQDRPNQLIAWRSVEGSDVFNTGRVRFEPAPGGRGTEVHVELHYRPPGGALGASLAKMFGEAPEQQIRAELRAFKQVIETGEVVHSDASIHRGPHPAQPPAW